MLTLAVSHNIFLTNEQRYALIDGDPVEAIGVSVPVWFFNDVTSEPASEVICKYYLTNTKEDFPVTILAKGYKINLPQLPEGHHLKEKPSDWDEMPVGQKENWKRQNPCPPTAHDLADQEDGGSKLLQFKRYTKIREGNKRTNAIHCVVISSMESLEKSLC